MTRLRVGSATDAGRVRSNNEDANLVTDGLFAVADGMGGHQGGAVASALAVQILEENATDPSLSSLKDGVRLANRAVFEAAGNDEALHGMGTTLCAIRVVETPEGDRLAWVNVGDSRVYIYRDGTLTKLSHDHSLVEDLVRDGQLTPDQAAVHPQRNIITRALGIEDHVEVDGELVVPYHGDIYLLCSDGLFNEIDEDRIAAVLRRLADPDEAAAELVRLANEHGGRDNITVVVIEVVDDGGQSAAASVALGDEPSGVRSPSADRPATVAGASDGDGAAGPGAGAAGGRDDDFYADLDRARTRHFTWRVAVFALVLVLVLGAAAGAVGWYARRTYYVGFRADRVTIFKGRPDGMLWFQPTVEQRTSITRADVPPARLAELEGGRDEATLADAQRYVDNLQEQVDRTREAATTTAPVVPPAITPPPTTVPGVVGTTTTVAPSAPALTAPAP